MRLLQPTRDLKAIFADYLSAAREHGARPAETGFRFLRENHLGLILLYPIFAVACPYVWIQKGRVSLTSQVILPLILVTGFLFIAFLYDKIMEHSRSPRLPNEFGPAPRNLALFLHLPVSAAGMFFLLHPALGYLMLFAAGAYSTLLSIRVLSLAHGRSLMDAFTRYLGAGILVMVPLVLMLLAMNIMRTYKIIQNLD